MSLILFGLLIFVVLFDFVFCSIGDRCKGFQDCLTMCVYVNCTGTQFLSNQPLMLRLLGWSCEEECRYMCMWVSVSQFQERTLFIPQFYGKWPFVRFLGIQEPASVLFSLLNLSSFWYLCVMVHRLPYRTPMRHIWLCYSLMGLHTWLWSSIFHSRDTPFTEKMDYFCAFGSVLLGFYACIIRVFSLYQKALYKVTLGVPFLAYYLYHVYYLGMVHFDYGYNMKINVLVGGTSSLLWLIHSTKEYFKGHGHMVWQCVFVVVFANGLLLLELGDFPPFLWLFDAHALWHLGTSPLAIFWAKFIEKDALLIRKKEE